MSSKMKLITHLDSTIKYLTPLLKLANCHMVEFITGDHWNKLPEPLRTELDGMELDKAVVKFWMYAEGKYQDTSELCNWITTAKSHYTKVNNDYCLSTEQLEERIRMWGGEIQEEIKITEFMNSKKSYEKQWHAIAKRIKNGIEQRITTSINKDLHRFATAFITEDTDLAGVVRDKFPEHDDTRLLLTGLHTCGDLGPACLRIFTKPNTVCLFNVPCCYHLLTETSGFPMSMHLKGYKLGRNARMLAAQSIDRVVHQKQLPAKSLLYRAMLEKIIKNRLPNKSVSEGKLKRMSSLENFQQYFQSADAILDLQIFDSFTQSCHDEINEELCYQWKKLTLFYFIRLCLAQVIETVILLDRILFLYENGINKVYLVKLFDPVLSPRCHSIVALK